MPRDHICIRRQRQKRGPTTANMSAEKEGRLDHGRLLHTKKPATQLKLVILVTRELHAEPRRAAPLLLLIFSLPCRGLGGGGDSSPLYRQLPRRGSQEENPKAETLISATVMACFRILRQLAFYSSLNSSVYLQDFKSQSGSTVLP